MAKELKSEMSLQDITKLARDVITNLVFMSDQVRGPNDIPMVFLPLALIDEKTMKDWQKRGIVHVWEFYSKSGPRGINGYPFFTSCHPINSTDYKKVREIEAKMREALEVSLG